MEMIENLDNLILKIPQDIACLESVYNLLKGDVFAYAYSILQDKSLAEDTVSETFLRLHKLSSRYKPSGQGRAFILKLCKNVAMEFYRQTNRQVYTDTLPETAAETANDDSIFIHQVLSRLNLNERQIIVLHYFSDMTFKEIAKSLSIPEGTVKWRYTSGMKKLQDYVVTQV